MHEGKTEEGRTEALSLSLCLSLSPTNSLHPRCSLSTNNWLSTLNNSQPCSFLVCVFCAQSK